MQDGGVDCGLYAIAYATEYCFGKDPTAFRYCQKNMRQHFLACVQKGYLSPFPSEGTRVKNPFVEHKAIYCDCRLPEDGKMACCSKCCNWYHQTCQSIPESVFAKANRKQAWYCQHCVPPLL